MPTPTMNEMNNLRRPLQSPTHKVYEKSFQSTIGQRACLKNRDTVGRLSSHRERNVDREGRKASHERGKVDGNEHCCD